MRDGDTDFETMAFDAGFDHVLGLSRDGSETQDVELGGTPVGFERDGSDLMVTLENGETVLVTDYFMQSNLPALLFGGAVWSGVWVAKLANAKDTVDVAQNGTVDADLGEPIGTVESIEGTVTVIRANGQRVTLNVGDPVYQGDTIETGPNSGIGITLADNTVLSLADDATMILDEMVYDPAAETGSAVISLLDGAATFVSGQIAKVDPDAMVINTPVATIGIRGTKAFIEVDGQNISAINMPEPSLDGDDTAGELVFIDKSGNVLGVINQKQQGLDWNSAGGNEPRIQLFSKNDMDGRTEKTTRNLPQTKVEKAIEAKEKVIEAKDKAESIEEQIEELEKQAADLKEQAEALEENAEDTLSEEEKLALLAEAERLAALAEEAEKKAEELDDQYDLALEEVAQLESEAEKAVEEVINSVGYKVNAPGTGSTGKTTGNIPINTTTPGSSGDDTISGGGDNDQLVSQTTTPSDGDDIIVPTTKTQPKTETTPTQVAEDPDPTYSGTVIDGYLEGARVFVDVNKNGVWDSGSEDSTTTIGNGSYTLQTDQIGDILVTGGIDVDNQQTFTGTMSAPQKAGVVSTITPLTSLINELMDNNGLSQADAQATVLNALGLSGSGIDLTSYDPYTNLTGSDPATAEQVMKAGIMLVTSLSVAKAAFGATSGSDAALASRALFKAVSENLSDFMNAGSGGTTVDALIKGAARNFLEFKNPGVDYSGYSDSDLANDLGVPQAALSNAVSSINVLNKIQRETTIPNGDYSALTKVQIVGIRDIAKEFETAVGSGDFTGVLAKTSESAINNAKNKIGGDGDDTKTGTSGDDILDGQKGNDLLIGNAGDDTLYGGKDQDTALYHASSEQYDVTFLNSNGDLIISGNDGTSTGYDGTDTLYDIEKVEFSDVTLNVLNKPVAAGDTMHGSLSADTLTGDANNNTMHGHHGDDIFFGQGGQDQMFGGAGNDLFHHQSQGVYNYIEGGRDVDTIQVGANLIYDFAQASGQANSIEVFNLSSGARLTNLSSSFLNDTTREQELVIDGNASNRVISAENKSWIYLGEENGYYRFQDNGFRASEETIPGQEQTSGETFLVDKDIVLEGFNAAPVATYSSATLAEDTSLDILLNDLGYDDAADTITVSIVSQQATGGSVTVDSETGDLHFTHEENYNGTFQFTYRLTDSFGATSQDQTVTLQIDPVNDIPVTLVSDITVTEDSSLSILETDLATDADGDSLFFEIAEGGAPSNGTVAFVNGSLVYTPNPQFNGSDSFTYAVTDAAEVTVEQTVTVTVEAENDAPVAIYTGQTLLEGQGVILRPQDLGTDIDDSFTVSIVTQQSEDGLVSIDSETGDLIYSPQENFNGDFTFTYRLTDSFGATTDQDVTLTITPVNDAPVGELSVLETIEDQAIQTPLSEVGSDVDGDELTYWLVDETQQQISVTSNASVVGGPLTITTANGATVQISEGVLIYDPASDFNGEDTFSYTVSDGTLTTTQSVTVTVTAQNDAPVATLTDATTDEDVALTLGALGSDPDGDQLTLSIVTQGTNGTASVVNGEIVYTPNADYHGADTFTYRLDDGNGGVTDQEVSVTVSSVNDTPVIETNAGLSVLTGETKVLTTDMLSASDVDGDPITYTLLTDPGVGVLQVFRFDDWVDLSSQPGSDFYDFTQSELVDGLVRYVHPVGTGSTDSFEFIVSDDNDAQSEPQTFNISALAGQEWVGTVDNDWGTAANWANGVLPDANKITYITSGTPEVGSDVGTIGALQLSGGSLSNVTNGALTLGADSTTDVGTDLNLVGGTFTNNGNLDVSGTLNWGTSYSSGGATLAGSGTIDVLGDMNFVSANSKTLDTDLVLNGNVNWVNNQYFSGTGSLTFNTNDDIEVANTIFVPIDVVSGKTVQLSTGANSSHYSYFYGGITNHGLLQFVDDYNGAGTVHLALSAATFLNAANSVFQTVNSPDGAYFSIDGQVTNLGTMDIDQSLTISNNYETFDSQGGSIDVAAGQNLTINYGDVIFDNTTALTGAGQLVFYAVTLDIGTGFTFTSNTLDLHFSGGTTINGTGAFTNSATMAFDNTNSQTFNVNFVNDATGTTTISTTNNGGTSLYFSGGFENHNLLVLDDVYSGIHNVYLSMSSATLVNETGATVRTTDSGGGGTTHTIDGDFTNRGTLDVDADLTVSSYYEVFDTSGGTIDVAAGQKLQAYYGTVIFDSDTTLIGDGTFDLYNVTLNIGSGYTFNSSTLTLTFEGATTINGDVGATFNNAQTLNFNTSSEIFNAGYVNEAGATTNLRTTNSGSMSITFAGGLTNSGLLLMDDVYSGSHSSAIQLNDSTFTNAAGATLQVTDSGGGGTSHWIDGDIVNLGTFDIDARMTIYNGYETFDTSSGTIDVATGQLFQISGGTVLLGSGTNLTGSGTFDIYNATVNVGAGYTHTSNSVNLTFTSSTTFTGDAEAAFTNQGTMVFGTSSETFNIAYVNAVGANTTLQSTSSGSMGITFNNGFDNYGTLRLHDTYSSGVHYANMELGSSSLINRVGATIWASDDGAGTSHYIDGDITNLGTIDVDANLYIENSYEVFDTSNGTIDVASGALMRVSYSDVILGAGTTLSGSGTLDFYGTIINVGAGYSHSTTTLDLTFSYTTTFTGDEGAAFTVESALTFDTNSETFNVEYANATGATTSLKTTTAGNTTITFNNGFVNAGLLVLDDVYSGVHYVNMELGNSSLTNQLGATIRATDTGTGGTSHYIDGDITNLGTIDVDANLYIYNNLEIFDTSNGTIDVASGALMRVSNGDVLLSDSTTLSGSGTLDFWGTTINIGSGYTHSTSTLDLTFSYTTTFNGDTGAAFTVESALTFDSNSEVFNVQYINADTGTTNIKTTTSSYTTVTFNSGFVNAGLLHLDDVYSGNHYATIYLNDSTLVNQTGATIRSTDSGGGGTSHHIDGDITNQGTIDVDAKLIVDNYLETFDTSSGTIDVAQNQTFQVQNGTVVFGSGTNLIGNGTFDVYGATLNIGSGYNHVTTTQSLTFSGTTTIIGDAEAAFTVESALTFNTNSETFNVSYVNAANATTTLSSTNSGYTTVYFNSGFINAGLLQLHDVYSGVHYATLNLGTSTLTNQVGGTIWSTDSSGGTNHYINGDITNLGTIDVDAKLVIQNSSEIFDTSSGTIDVADSQLFQVSSGTVLFGAQTTLTGNGTVDLANVTLNIGSGYTHSTTTTSLTFSGTTTINGDVGAAFSVDGDLTLNSNSETFNVSYEVAQGGTTTVQTTNSGYTTVYFNAGIINAGTFRLDDVYSGSHYASVELSNASFVNQAGATLWVTDTGSGGTSHAIDGDITNLGTIDVDASLYITNSSEVFDTSNGTIDIAQGQVLRVNNGTVNFGNNTTLSGSGTLDLNNTTLNIGSGYTHTTNSLSVLFTGSVSVTGDAEAQFTNDGTFNLNSSSDSFSVNYVNNSGATTNIQSTNSSSTSITFNAGFENHGALTLHDVYSGSHSVTMYLGSTLLNASDGTVTTSDSSGGATHFISGSFSNAGLFSVESNTYLNQSSSTFNNTGTVDIKSGASLLFSNYTASYTNVADGLFQGGGTLDLASNVIFYNNGTINPGYDGETATLSVTGNGRISLGDTSVLHIDMTKGETVSADMVSVANAVDLNGTLNIAASLLVDGDSATVLSAGTTTGAFDQITGLQMDSSILLDPVFSNNQLALIARTIDQGTSGSYLVGSASNDTLTGNGSSDQADDVILAGDGDDVIHLDPTAFNFVDGGNGADKLVLSANADLTSIRDDVIQSVEILEIGSNSLTLNADDILGMSDEVNGWTGEANSLVILGNGSGLPSVTLDGGTWDAGTTGVSIIGGPSNVTYTVYTESSSGAKIYLHEGGSLVNVLYGDQSDNTLVGTSGVDTINGGAGNDSIDGDTNVDTVQFEGLESEYIITVADNIMTVSDQNATSYGNDGTDTLTDVEIIHFLGSDTYYSPSFSLTGTIYADILSGGLVNDTLSGANGDDVIYASDGNDILSGGSGKDTLDGGAGNDTIQGNGDADVMIGGEGDDTIDGDTDSALDVAVYAGNSSNYTVVKNPDGSYTITDTNVADGDMGTDVVSAVEILRFDDGDVNLDYTLNGTIYDDTLSGAENGDTINASNGADTVYGLAGNDTLSGGSGADVIDGGTGDDTLYGNGDADTLIGGEGDDVIDGATDSALDVAVFAGNMADFTIVKNQDNSYTVTDTNTADGDMGTDTVSLVEILRFDDGDVNLDYTINGTIYDDTLSGAEFGDSINASNGNDTVYGLGGDDTLIGGSGADLLDGGIGDDTLTGNGDADTLIGGEGNDIIDGATDSALDVAVFAGNIADFTIVKNLDNSYTVTDTNVADGDMGTDTVSLVEILRFDDGDVNLDYTLNGTIYDDTLSGAENNDSIAASNGNDTVFGLAGNDTILGGSGADVIDGGAGDDTLSGNGDADTITGGEGNDIIDGATDTALDVAVFAGNIADFTIVKNPDNSYTVTDTNAADGDMGTDTVSLVEILRFDDGDVNLDYTLNGTIYDDTLSGAENNDSIAASNGNDTVFGLAGNDTILGGSGADVIDGGAGDDTLSGNGDADTITGGEGNDIINGATDSALDIAVFAGSGEDYSVVKNQDGSYSVTDNYALDGDMGTDTVSLVEILRFDDGDLHLDYTLTGTIYEDTLSGAGGDDSLSSGNGDDVLNGNGGNDTLNGGSGADILNGGAGDDTLIFGNDDNDIYNGDSGTDTVQFSGTFTLNLATDTNSFNLIEIFDADNSAFTFDMITADQIEGLTGDGRTLQIIGDGNDTINFDPLGGWSQGQDVDVNGTTYNTYQSTSTSQNTVTVLVNPNDTVTGAGGGLFT